MINIFVIGGGAEEEEDEGKLLLAMTDRLKDSHLIKNTLNLTCYETCANFLKCSNSYIILKI